MKRILQSLCTIGCIATLASGCGFPLEESTAVDTRPMISFKAITSAENVQFAVDGVSYGSVENYLEGKAALRVLPGTHTITIIHPNGTSSSQKVFVSNGIRKTIVVQ